MNTVQDIKSTQSEPLVSIVIRSHNEEKYIKQVLESIKGQLYQNFEIIMVDDHSKDKTLEIADQYGCKIVSLPDKQFSHAYSCNRGAEESNGKYIAFLNGHSIPVSNKFLDSGIENLKDERVAGSYAMPISHKDGTLADWILNDTGVYMKGLTRYEADKHSPGILATLGSMIRKDLWEEYPFREINGGMGGEDYDWAVHVLDNGYKVIHDPRLRVRHSHHLKLKDIPWQWKNRGNMATGKEIPDVQRKYF